MNASVLVAQVRAAPIAVRLYLVAVFAMGFTVEGGIYSVLQNLYLLRLGYDPAFIGLFNSAGLLLFAALSLPIGGIERWSSRRLLLAGAVLMGVGSFLIPSAFYVAAPWQAAALLAGRLIALAGLSLFFVHSPPFIMGATEGEWQNRALAWQMAMLSIAGFAGGLLAGYLPGWVARLTGETLRSPVPYQLPLFMGTAVLAITLVAIWRAPEPGDDASNRAPETAVGRPGQTSWLGPLWLFVVVLSLVRVFQVAVPGAVITFANVYFDDGLGVATSTIGLLAAAGKLLSVPMALLVPWALRRWGGFNAVLIVSVASIAATLPMVFADSWVVAGFGFILVTVAGPLRYLSFLVFSLSLVEARRRAVITGAGEMAIGFGFAGIALAGGYLIVWFGYTTMFAVSLALTGLGTLLFWGLYGRYQDRTARRLRPQAIRWPRSGGR